MSQTRRSSSRSISATEKGKQLLGQAKAARKIAKHSNSFQSLAAATDLSDGTVRKFFKGIPVDKGSAQVICDCLGLDIKEIVNPEDLNKTVVKLKPGEKQLQELIRRCREMLALKTQSLTTNPLTARQGVTHNIDDLYVDVTVVKPFQLTKQEPDACAQQGSKLYEHKETSQIFKPGEFFDKVILPKLRPETKSQPIAIIGEPGAGKTSLLQKIASRIVSTEASLLKEEEPVVIWVSLAEVGNQPLRQYLLTNWLTDAAKSIVAASKEWENALEELLKSGRVWLLLDAVDELGGDNLLENLAEQFQQGWMHQVQVVLTCRFNVWNRTFNVLADKVETYCTSPFSYKDEQGELGFEDDAKADQVAQFISKWFHDSPENGEALRNALNEAGKERLKDMVKNPLRLALLCNTWNLWQEQGGLPDTKAKLYKGFVDNYYDLQHKSIVSTRQRCQLLNEALGELALWAIDQPTSRFRIRLKQIPASIAQTLGDADEEGLLLWLALNLGWLNHVGVAAESPDEAVYAFFHPTFEEYFAACAIDDWHFFCEGTPNSPEGEQPRWRILEPQWREVFLLWLGREDVSELKEPLLQHLCSPSSWVVLDDSNKFDGYQALFLTVVGMAEFKDFSRAEEVLDLCIDLSNPRCFFDRQQGWIVSPNPVGHFAREALLQTNRDLASRRICQKLRQLEKPELLNCEFMLLMLSHIGVGNLEASDTLTELLLKIKNEELALLTAITLGKINPGNDWAIKTLIDLIRYSQNTVLVAAAIESLGDIAFNNSSALSTLTSRLEGIEDEELTLVIARSVEKISPGNQKAIAAVIKLLQNSRNRAVLFDALDYLGQSALCNNEAISALSERLKITKDRELARSIAITLARIDRGNLMTWIDYSVSLTDEVKPILAQ